MIFWTCFRWFLADSGAFAGSVAGLTMAGAGGGGGAEQGAR